MLFRLAFIVLVLVIVFVVMRMALRGNRMSVQRFFSLYIAAVVGLAFIYLGLSGRLNWLFILVGSALPFLSVIITYGMRLLNAFSLYRTFKGWLGMRSSGTPNPGKQSQIQTDFFDMRLDHDTGELSGLVRKGVQEGKQLKDLSIEQLNALLQEVKADQDSLNVLIAFLDRVHPGWQKANGAEPGDQQYQTGGSSSELDENEALEILGLGVDAGVEDIVTAHRRLIQKFHPDRGGSTYLAARINEAKDLLIKLRGKK